MTMDARKQTGNVTMLTPEEFAASLLDDWHLDSVIKKIAERDEEIRDDQRSIDWNELEQSGRI